MIFIKAKIILEGASALVARAVVVPMTYHKAAIMQFMCYPEGALLVRGLDVIIGILLLLAGLQSCDLILLCGELLGLIGVVNIGVALRNCRRGHGAR